MALVDPSHAEGEMQLTTSTIMPSPSRTMTKECPPPRLLVGTGGKECILNLRIPTTLT